MDGKQVSYQEQKRKKHSMRNVSVDLGDGYSLSLFQSDVTGLVEIVPIYESDTEGGLIGEPVYVKGAEELIELVQSALDKDFAIWENQYYIELEAELDEHHEQYQLGLVVDNTKDADK